MNPNRFNNKKEETQKYDFVIKQSDVFYGLQFFSTSNSLYRNNKPIKCTPNVIIDNDNILFDYSGCDEESFLYIKNLMSNISKGSTITYTDFIYRDSSLTIDDQNFSTSYEYLNFIPDKKIITVKKPSDITINEKIKRFVKENFIYTPQLEISSFSSSESISGIINHFGEEGENSFTYKHFVPGNYIKFFGTSNNDSKLFEIDYFYTDFEGREIVIFKNECIEESLLSTPVLFEVYQVESTEEIQGAAESYITEIEYDIISGDSTGIDYYERSAPGVTTPDCNCPTDTEPPIMSEPPTEEQKRKNQEWIAKQMKCCKCLLYAEASCNRDCQMCVAWTLYNRRRDAFDAVVRDERYPCRQAESREFSGRCSNNNKFKACHCNRKIGNSPDPANPLEKRCLDSADLACRRIGLTNWKKLVDPTGGANYFMRCGAEPGWMPCNIVAGICTKVDAKVENQTEGFDIDCSSCPTCFYKCTRTPQPCSALRQAGLIGGTDDAPEPGALSAYFDAVNNPEQVVEYVSGEEFTPSDEITPAPTITEPYAIDGYYPLYLTPEAAREASPTPNKRRPGERTAGYHVVIIRDQTYYRPNGLIVRKTQFDGDYPYQWL